MFISLFDLNAFEILYIKLQVKATLVALLKNN